MQHAHLDQILESLRSSTHRIFETALGAKRHKLLMRRLYELYGARELARLLNHGTLARRIECQIDVCLRDIETD